jgi:hypothetical protein
VLGLVALVHAEPAFDRRTHPCDPKPVERVHLVEVARPGEPRCGTLGIGVGAAFISGANADGYAPGVSERVTFRVATGRLVQFAVSLDHARHDLVDAGAYYPTVTVPEGSLSGFRDYFVADIGFRYHIPIVILEPHRMTVSPWIHTGVAVAYTSTRVEGPGFAGPVALRSTALWPGLSVGAGAELRFTPWLSADPHLIVQGMLLPDAPESASNSDTVSGELRFLPSLDVNVRF